MYSTTNETQEGVTIIVWLPTFLLETTLFSGSSATIVNNELSFGHAALRTYKGGENGNGDYLSFYPGRLDCGCGYENQDQAHFHRIQADEEDCYKDLVEMGALKRFTVHLDIVNVEAVNQRIRDIKSAKGRIWGFQQNCSDLVLEALRAGTPDFSSHIYQKPYGWKTGAFFILMGIPSLFALRMQLSDWFLSIISNDFVQKFLTPVKPSETKNLHFNRMFHLIIGPTLFKWLFYGSALKTKRVPGRLNPTFQEDHIFESMKNYPINFSYLKYLPEDEKDKIEIVIELLAKKLIQNREVQQFFAYLVLSWNAQKEKVKWNIIPSGALINVHFSWLYSALYFMFTLGKHKIPFSDKLNLAVRDGLKVAFCGLFFQIGLYGMGQNGPFKLEIMTHDLMFYISSKATLLTTLTFRDVIFKIFPILPMTSIKVAAIGMPPLLLMFYIKKQHDTVVTPSYVLTLVNGHKKTKKENSDKIYKTLPKTEPSSKSIFSFFNKKTLLVTGAVLASSALLFYDFDKFRLTTNPPKLALT